MQQGSLFKRKRSKYWVAQFRDGRGGRRVQRSTGETNRILAVKRLEEMLEEANGYTNESRQGQKITLAEFCQLPDPRGGTKPGGEYWQYLVANKAGTTRARSADVIRTQLIPQFGQTPLARIRPREVENWKQQRLAQVQRASVLKELHVLSHIFKVARRVFGYLQENPVSHIEKPTVPKRKKRIPSPIEMQRFLEVAAQFAPDHFPPLLTLYQGGLRIDELRHLEQSDVDLEHDLLRVRVKPGWSPKDQEDRDIPLAEPLRSVLKHLLAVHSEARWLFPRKDRRTVFCQRCDRRETHLGNLRKTILTIAETAKVPQHVTHHLMRHCHSTHSRKLGATDYEVMEILGQQSTRVHSLYTHAEWSGMVDASRRLGESLGQNGLTFWLAPQKIEVIPPLEPIDFYTVPR